MSKIKSVYNCRFLIIINIISEFEIIFHFLLYIILYSQFITYVFQENVRLKSCDLSWNGFGPKGGAAIADALSTNESLQELSISGNRLDVESAILIAKALKKNEELKVLKVVCHN